MAFYCVNVICVSGFLALQVKYLYVQPNNIPRNTSDNHLDLFCQVHHTAHQLLYMLYNSYNNAEKGTFIR